MMLLHGVLQSGFYGVRGCYVTMLFRGVLQSGFYGVNGCYAMMLLHDVLQSGLYGGVLQPVSMGSKGVML